MIYEILNLVVAAVGGCGDGGAAGIPGETAYE